MGDRNPFKIKLVAATLFTALGTKSALANCGEVSITEMEWALSAVVTSVDKFLLETGYGCTLNAVPSSTTPAMASIAETGEPEILTELWTNSSPVYEELRSERKMVELGHVQADGGIEAWWTPADLAEAHQELKTLDGILANPHWSEGSSMIAPPFGRVIW